jgi:DNA modification methylase
MGFGRAKAFFDAESVRHPAKANLYLLQWIISNFTDKGDTVVDPLAGTGSTAIMASLLGRNGVCVELENKFCELIDKNFKLTVKSGKARGGLSWFQGDARYLSSVLKNGMYASTTIMSPPYADGTKGQSREKFWARLARDPTSKRFGRKSHPTIGEGYDTILTGASGYTLAPNAIVSSPTYGDTFNSKRHTFSGIVRRAGKEKRLYWGGYSGKEAQIGNLPYIITSPPYASTTIKKTFKSEEELERFASGQKWLLEHGRSKASIKRFIKKSWQGYPANDENNNAGNLPYIITSPTYGTTGVSGGNKEKRIERLEKNGYHPKEYVSAKARNTVLLEYGKSKGQLGSMPYNKNGKTNRGEDYLTAMKRVYSESWKVLRPGGELILILKDFIRQKHVVPLHEHTISLCESVGFSLEAHYLFKLPTESFWRRLHRIRDPNSPQIKFEDVLILRKNAV